MTRPIRWEIIEHNYDPLVGNKTMTELCREHDIADSLLRKVARAASGCRRGAIVGPDGAQRG